MPKKNTESRAKIIDAVKTYLGFYALLALIVEGALGGLAFKSDGINQLIAISGMILVIVGLIGVVSFFAYRKPEVLLQKVSGQQKLSEFGRRISGYWWQKLIPDEPCALSLVEISPCTATNAVKLEGRAYSREGDLVAHWETEASFIQLNEKKIFYAWERKRSSPDFKPYEGFGQISFHEAEGQFRGEGFFLDINFNEMANTKKFSTEYWRIEKHELQTMLGNNGNLKSELIQNKLKEVG